MNFKKLLVLLEKSKINSGDYFNKTETSQKEITVLLSYLISNINTYKPLSADNIEKHNDIIKNWITDMKNIWNSGIKDKTITTEKDAIEVDALFVRIEKILNEVEGGRLPKLLIEFVNGKISQGKKLNKQFSNKNYIVERTEGLFSNIKLLATFKSTETGEKLFARGDNWNPMDVMLFPKAGAKFDGKIYKTPADLDAYISNIFMSKSAKKSLDVFSLIAKLNLMFDENTNEKNRCVGVSLKESDKSQLGKITSWMNAQEDKINEVKEEAYLTEADARLSFAELVEKIQMYRDKMYAKYEPELNDVKLIFNEDENIAEYQKQWEEQQLGHKNKGVDDDTTHWYLEPSKSAKSTQKALYSPLYVKYGSYKVLWSLMQAFRVTDTSAANLFVPMICAGLAISQYNPLYYICIGDVNGNEAIMQTMHSTLAPKLIESANRLPAGSPWVIIKDNGFGLRDKTLVEKGGSLAVFVQLLYNNTPHAFRIDIRAMNEVGRFIDIDGTLAPATKFKGIWTKNEDAKIRPGEVSGQLAYKKHIEDAKDWQKLYASEEELGEIEED